MYCHVVGATQAMLSLTRQQASKATQNARNAAVAKTPTQRIVTSINRNTAAVSQVKLLMSAAAGEPNAVSMTAHMLPNSCNTQSQQPVGKNSDSCHAHCA